MPRRAPRREREWLSCTKSASIPISCHTLARKVSTKNPRSSPWTADSSSRTPSRLVGRARIEAVRVPLQDRGGRVSKQPLPMKRAATTTPVPVPAPVDGQKTLSSYITARFDEFSRSQKDVAQYIVDHGRPLLPGAGLRGLPRAPVGRPRGVPPPARGGHQRGGALRSAVRA